MSADAGSTDTHKNSPLRVVSVEKIFAFLKRVYAAGSPPKSPFRVVDHHCPQRILVPHQSSAGLIWTISTKKTYQDTRASLEQLSPEIARALPPGPSIAAMCSSAGVTATEKTKVFTKEKATPVPASKTGASGKRGMGRVYRPTWRDKRTGQIKEAPVWWIAYSVRGTLSANHPIQQRNLQHRDYCEKDWENRCWQTGSGGYRKNHVRRHGRHDHERL